MNENDSGIIFNNVENKKNIGTIFIMCVHALGVYPDSITRVRTRIPLGR